MDADFWKARWDEGRIGFHEGRVNRLLARHAGVFEGKRRVLVPLCGKAEDMAFLASKGLEVVGVELSERAVRAFFDEHGRVPDVASAGPCQLFTSGPYTLVLGDLFDTSAALVGPVDTLYDRAALVALPEATRRAYTRHVRAVAPGLTGGLVVTFEYPQERMPGPPFSVSEDELRALYPDAQISLLDEGPAAAPRFAEHGLSVTERCFSLAFAGA